MLDSEYCRVCGVIGTQRDLRSSSNRIAWHGCESCKRVWGNVAGIIFIYDAFANVSFVVPDCPPKYPAKPPISDDEMIQVHEFLKSFEKPLTELIAS